MLKESLTIQILRATEKFANMFYVGGFYIDVLVSDADDDCVGALVSAFGPR